MQAMSLSCTSLTACLAIENDLFLARRRAREGEIRSCTSGSTRSVRRSKG